MKTRRGRGIALTVALLIIGAYIFAFPGRRVAVPDTPYVLTIQPGVSEQSVALVRDGLGLADRFLIDTTGTTLSAPAAIRIASFSPCSPLKPLPQLGATAEVVGNRLCVNTANRVWRQGLNDNPGIALSVIAHEHYHLVQHELGCLPSPWNKQYDWLIEGGAAYIGWQTAIASGRLDRAWVDDLLVDMRSGTPIGTLQSYEAGIGGDASYSLAYQAVQQLVDRSGSPRSLNDFCSRVGQGTPWRDAFAQAFGTPLDAFYADFEAAHRGSSAIEPIM